MKTGKTLDMLKRAYADAALGHNVAVVAHSQQFEYMMNMLYDLIMPTDMVVRRLRGQAKIELVGDGSIRFVTPINRYSRISPSDIMYEDHYVAQTFKDKMSKVHL